MMINKKIFAIAALASVVGFMAMTPPQQQDDKPKFTNLKVLPKNISGEKLHEVMEEWEHALGARCGFCHARNEETKKMDWASDAKPEKDMARHMFKMMGAINKKYFEAKKDSTGMIAETGINCNTCHRGTSHPEVVKASGGPRPAGFGPGGPGPGPGQGGPGGPPPGGQGGTPPPPPPSGGQK